MDAIRDSEVPLSSKLKESRNFLRIVTDMPIILRAGEQIHRGWCANISEGGAAFSSSTRFSVGQELCVTLSLPGGRLPVVATAVIRHVSGYMHGCEFRTMLPHDRAAIAAFVNDPSPH